MMNFTLSKSLRIGAGAACLSAALMMGACGPKDKGGAPIISAEKAPLGLSGLSDKDFAQHFAVPKRKTDSAEADNALAALGLSESNADGLTWDKLDGSGGNYVFTNMKSTSDNGNITIGKAQLFGVHMEGEDATFDRADFGNVLVTGDAVTLKVGAMSLARPTAATAKALITNLENMAEDTDLDFGDDGKFGFGALSMKSVDITADEVTGTIDQLVWGRDEATEQTDIKVENVDLNIPEKDSKVASLLTLKSFSARGINSKTLSKGFSAGIGGGNGAILTEMLSGLNVFEKPYDSIKLESFKFDNAEVNIDLPNIEAESSNKGDVTTVTQVLAPTTITFKDTGSGPSNQAYDMLQQLGFDAITLKTSQTTILDKGKDTMEVKDGIFDMTDGFRLNYTYEATGLNGLTEAHSDKTAQLKNTLENMKLNGMTLSLVDKSIVERGLKLAAQMRGNEVKSIKREMRAALAIAPLIARNDLEKALAGELGGAFMDFIDDGGTLTIKLAPQEPIVLSKLQDIETLSPKDIGFSARHDK